MARNNAWSNLRLYRACLTLTDEAFAERRVSFFPSLQLTLNHILLVDRYYFDALIGGGAGLTIFDNELPYPRAADLWDAQARSDQQLLAFCESLDRRRSATRSPDRPRPVGRRATRARSAAYCRMCSSIRFIIAGQAHAMLSGTAAAPPQLDEFFLAADAPLRVAELANWSACASRELRRAPPFP